MKIWKILPVIPVILSISLISACSGLSALSVSSSRTTNSAQESSLVSSDMPHSAAIASGYKWQDYVNDQYTAVDGTPRHLGDFLISLRDYFYDIDAGVVTCRFTISDTYGEKPSETQTDQLKKDIEVNDLQLILDSDAVTSRSLVSDEGSDIVWLVSKNISVTMNENNPSGTAPEELTLKYNDDETTIQVPAEGSHENTITFDTSINRHILFCRLGEYELNIIWDITDFDIQSDSETSNGSDGRTYPYHTITLKRSDGTAVNLTDQNGSGLHLTGNSRYEYDTDTMRAQLWARFYEGIDVSEISSLIIDGTIYRVSSPQSSEAEENSADAFSTGWDKYVEDNYTVIDEKYQKLAGLQISLNRYFYDIDAGIISCRFSIMNSDGTMLSDEQYSQLKTDHDQFYDRYKGENYERVILASFDLQSMTEENILSRGSDGSVSMIIKSVLLNSVDDESVKGENIPSRVTLTYNNCECTFALPDTFTKENTLQFDTSLNKDILFLSLGEYEFNIVWDITESYSEFNKNDKAETETTNESDTSKDSDSFTPYNIIAIKYKDGKSAILTSADGAAGDITKSENYKYDSNINRAQLWARFDNKLDLTKIKSISIDGKEIPVR